MNYWNKIKHQEVFQGKLKKKHYFEGWYYKQVTHDGESSISVIPGICTDARDAHAFIQLIETKSNASYYIRYRLDDFEYHENPFSIRIGENYFSLDHFSLQIHQVELDVEGTLRFQKKTPIKKNWFQPNIMGPFAYIRMQCNHGVISLNHQVNGSITINEETLLFDRGHGYMEKDYGRSFPKKYLWLQSNYTNTGEIGSFFLSIAHIPVSIFSFTGFLCLFFYKGKEYRFTTYNLSKIKKIEIKDHQYQIIIKKKKFLIKIKGKWEGGMALIAPRRGEMSRPLKECLNAEFEVSLYHQGILLGNQQFSSGGCEIVSFS